MFLFQEIGAMYSSLVAVDVCGALRQWRWNNREGGIHPKNNILNLDKEKVKQFVMFSRLRQKFYLLNE